MSKKTSSFFHVKGANKLNIAVKNVRLFTGNMGVIRKVAPRKKKRRQRNTIEILLYQSQRFASTRPVQKRKKKAHHFRYVQVARLQYIALEIARKCIIGMDIKKYARLHSPTLRRQTKY